MSKNILIVGAGLGGLSAAATLLRRGHNVRVFEQSPVLGEVGAGIQISANASKVLYSLGLRDALEHVGVAPIGMRFRAFDSAELLHEIPLGDAHERAYRAKYFHVHRADLHRMLSATVRALDPGAITLGVGAVRFEEHPDSVTAHFSDGSQSTGDLLIGADGLNSAIRAQIIGNDEACFTGFAAWRAVVPATRLPQRYMDRVCTVWVGPNAHAVVYYLRRGELVNFVGIVESDSWRDESWIVKASWDKLKADFVPWHDDVQLLIDSLPKDACYRWALYDRPPVVNWSTARATLLGDAAHPTLPFMAQGAAMAIEDAAILARALEHAESIDAALRLYESNRSGRTARIQTAASELGELYREQVMSEFRKKFDKHDLSKDRNRWLYSYDPLTTPLLEPAPR